MPPPSDNEVLTAGGRRRLRDLDFEPEVVLVSLIGMLLVVVLGLGIWVFTRADDPCAGGICEGADPIGVSRSADGETIAVNYLRCGAETITRIALEPVEGGEPLWELTGSYRGTRTAFVVGQPTDEMQETVAFSSLPTSDVRVVVEADERHEAVFNRRELLRGFIAYSGVALTADEFSQIARANGSCPDWEPALGSSFGRWAQIVLVALAAAIGIVAALRLRPGDET